MGIEPTRPAWKAGSLPLTYTRIKPGNIPGKWWPRSAAQPSILLNKQQAAVFTTLAMVFNLYSGQCSRSAEQTVGRGLHECPQHDH